MLLRAATGSLVAKVAGAISGFLLAIVVARYLGANQAGVYYTAIAIVLFLTFVGRLGLDQLVMREMAAATTGNGGNHQVTFGRMALIAGSCVLVASIGLLLSAATISEVMGQPQLAPALRIGALSVAATAVLNIAAQMLRGGGRITKSSFLLFAAGNLLVLSILGPLYLLGWSAKDTPGVVMAMWAYAGAAVIAALLGLLWLHGAAQDLPKVRHGEASLTYREIVRSSMSFMLFGLSARGISWVDTLVLAAFSNPAQVAIYNSALRLTLLVSFTLTAVVTAVGPQFAALHRAGETDKITRLFHFGTALSISLALPATLAFWIFGGPLLGIFGQEFRQGTVALAVLAAGQLVSAAYGPHGQLLMATRHEALVRNIGVGAFLICITLHLTLVPWIGMLGSALATAVTVSISNVAAGLVVTRRLQIEGLFSAIRRRRL